MYRTTPRAGHRRTLRCLGAALVALALASGVTGAARAAEGAHDYGTADPNPTLDDACGVPIYLVLDRSQSIADASAGDTVRGAAQAFVDALAGTPSELGVITFSTTATVDSLLLPGADADGYLDMSDPGEVATAKTPFTSPSPVFTGGTNWQDAFLKVQGRGAELVVIITDGEPTLRNDEITTPADAGDLDQKAATIAANTVKSEGTRIMGIGVGFDNPTLPPATLADRETRMQLITGPTEDADYFLTADFNDLSATIAQVVTSLCGATVAIHKTVGGTDGAGFEFTASPSDRVDSTNPVVSDADGMASFEFNGFTPVSVTITESERPGYTIEQQSLHNAVCVFGDGSAVPLTSTANGITMTLGPTDHVQCDWHNRELSSAIDLTKTASASVVYSGDPVDFDYTITTGGGEDSLGTVTLADPACTPVLTGGDTDADNRLDPGETWTATCTVNPTVSGSSTGTATGVDNLGRTRTDTATVAVTVIDPGIHVDKSGSVPAIDVGDSVMFAYDVTNSGDVPLTGVTVSDESCSPVTYVSGDTDGDAALDLTETWVFTCVATPGLTVPDASGTATATGNDPLSAPVTDTDDLGVTVAHPTITVIADPFPGTIDPGDTSTITYTVTPGPDPLTGIVVVDDHCTPVTYVSGDTDGDSVLDVGEAWTYTCEASPPDDLTSTVTATGTSPLGTPVTDDAPVVVNVNGPAIGIVKTAGKPLVHVGDLVTYTYAVTNPGSDPLHTVTVADPGCAPVVLVGDGILNPGETWTGTCTTAVASNSNTTATATGLSTLGNPVTATDADAVGVITPLIDIEVTADPATLEPGATTTLTYVVTNTGTTPLSNVVVTDSVLGTVGTIASLAPGASTTLTKTTVVTAGSASHHDGTALGTDSLGRAVSDVDGADLSVVLGVVTRRNPSTPLPATGMSELLWQLAAIFLLAGSGCLLASRRRLLVA